MKRSSLEAAVAGVLTLTAAFGGEPFPGVPSDVARRLWVWVSGETEKWASIRDLRVRPGALWTWVDDDWFEARFHFRGLTSRRVNFAFLIEGSTAVEISHITLHSCGDAVARLFEKGLVLATPSLKPFTFDLARLYPGRRFRRLKGVRKEGLAVNNGEPVGASVTLPPRDGLFLLRRMRQ